MVRSRAVLMLLVCGALGMAQDGSPMRHGTVQDTVQGMKTPGSQGWARFDAAQQLKLKLSDGQMNQLHDRDAGGRDQYNNLGIEPWKNKDFPALNEQRNTAIQGILSKEQYGNWARSNTRPPTLKPATVPAHKPSSTPPR